MMTDPTSLLVLLLLVGILAMLVLILPLMIIFWSQMEPQLVGLVSGMGQAEGDEYESLVLPKMMNPIGRLAGKSKAQSPQSERKAAAKPKARGRASATTPRSKASSDTRTVKVAPARGNRAKAAPATSKASAKTRATPGAKSEAGVKAKTRKPRTGAAAAKPKPGKAASDSAARRTAAGAKRDPVLGVIYTRQPKEIDNLKEIKGVAKVIEAKLHQAGIYTFRQIVEWDAAAIDAFSERLSFKGRIGNEGWQKQCADLHKAKYGEKIG